jgi:mono/diheme cytochrome c family protein
MTTALLVLAFLVLGLGVLLVAMRSGRKGPVLDPSKRSGRRGVWLVSAAVILLFGAAVPIAIGFGVDLRGQAGPVALSDRQQQGRDLFNVNCVQCHELAASQSYSRVGPNLDVLRPPAALTLDAIEKGRARGQGQMPSLLLTGPDAEAVADYVEAVAGRGGP